MDRPYAGPIGVNLNSTSGPAYGGFLPTQLSGCVLWLRADLGVTKDGSDKVSAWADQSGSGNDVVQPTGARQPTWQATGGPGGGPALLFSESAQTWMYRANVLNGDGTCTIAAIGKTTGSGAMQRRLCDGNSATNVRLVYASSGASTSYTYSGAAVGLAGWAANTWHSYVAVFNGASSVHWRNGAEALGDSGGGAGSSGITIGAQNDGANHWWDGPITEVVAYSRPLSAVEYAQLGAYLMARP